MNGFDSTTILGQRRRILHWNDQPFRKFVTSTISRCLVCNLTEPVFDLKALRLICPNCLHDEKL